MDERFKTKQGRNTGQNLPEEVRLAVIKDLKEGLGVRVVSEKYGVSTHAVTALRNSAEDADSEFNIAAWKKTTANTLSHFVSKGSKRLVDEVDNIPLASLPIAIAVAVDKIAALHDQPQTVVEHRLKIDHEQVTDLLKREGLVIEGEFTEAEPES